VLHRSIETTIRAGIKFAGVGAIVWNTAYLTIDVILSELA
jgi:hypothetical protein